MYVSYSSSVSCRAFVYVGQLDLAAECFRRHLRATSSSPTDGDNNEEEEKQEEEMRRIRTANDTSSTPHHSHMSVDNELQEMNATGKQRKKKENTHGNKCMDIYDDSNSK